MEFSFPNRDHGSQSPLANLSVPGLSECHSYANGYSPYSPSQSQIPLAPGISHLSTAAPMVDVQHPRPPPGEGVITPENVGRGLSRSPPSAPPNYHLYSQEDSALHNAEFLPVPHPPSPSYKALGKRRASSIDTPTISTDYQHDTPQTSIAHDGPDTPATPYTGPTGGRARQKGRPKAKAVVRPPKAPAPRTRIMPSRQRRGTTAYGIGSNPIDAMIIEAQQRAAEYVPIVDSDAVFLITTDPKGPPVAGPSTAGGEERGKEDERYFEREEVAENLRQQAIIQTPEYCLLSEVYQPSSRLRTRTEADIFDSSDAAYERRHRKPEMFEKRQRRREKDKLEHERYKLKERVEQLRAMDLHHFRALLPPHATPGVESTQELEVVRSELLAHADDLIRRYDVLLPPDPRAANGQRLRLKEWEVRREGNRFIPLTDEAASELAAAGLLDEQSAAEAAAAGLLITATGPGLPSFGGKGGKGYGVGFRPNISSSEDEGGEDGEDDTGMAHNEEEVESDRPSSPEAEHDEEPEVGGTESPMPIIQEPPRVSSGMLKIKLKVPRPSITPKSSDLSQDLTRPPSAAGNVVTQTDKPVGNIDVAATEVPQPEPSHADDSQIASSPAAHLEPCIVPHLTDGYPTPAPSTISLGGTAGVNTGTWTELPYHDVPYEHQPRGIPLSSPALPLPPLPPASPVATTQTVAPVQTVVAPRVKTPVASTPAPTGMPLLLVAAERGANQAAGRRGRNLRTAEAFGVKLPRALEEEQDFKLPEEWITERDIEVDDGSLIAS